MKNNLMAAIAAGIAVTGWVAPVVAAAQASDQAQLRALESRFGKAFAAKDVDAIMKVYAPDVFVFDLVPPRQYVGAAAYRQDWKETFAGFKGPIKFEMTDLVLSTDGNIGYGHSIQHVSGVDTKGAASDLTVRVTDVYRKKNGKWLIVHEHVSVPVDLATLKADPTSKP
jgi:ketosteroid isomerase-like protein